MIKGCPIDRDSRTVPKIKMFNIKSLKSTDKILSHLYI